MKQVRLLTDSILANFAHAVFVHRDIIYRLWIVAPWVGYEQARTDPILQLIDALRGKKKSVTIITRPPAEIWHANALRLMMPRFLFRELCCFSGRSLRGISWKWTDIP